MVKDIKLIESVQRCAAQIAPTLSLLPCEERLKLLDPYQHSNIEEEEEET